MATITLPDALVEKSHRLAEKTGLSLDELYDAALTQYAHKVPANLTLREQFDAVYAGEDSRLDPLFAAAQVRALPELKTGEDW